MVVSHEPALLSPSRLDAASALLARAFRDDPMMRHMLPEDRRRGERLPGFLGGVASYALAYGEVWTTNGPAGIACWLPPG